MKHCKVKNVWDYSPGSGQLAIACLEMGILYTGICKGPEHLTMLSHIVDRHALCLMNTPKTPLFSQLLSTLIKSHFGSLLAALEAASQAGDEIEPEE